MKTPSILLLAALCTASLAYGQTDTSFLQEEFTIDIAPLTIEPDKREDDVVTRSKPVVGRNIRGTVTGGSKARYCLPAIVVQVKGTDIGTQTDIEGNYQLTVPDSCDTLIFRSPLPYYYGAHVLKNFQCETQEVPINNRTTIDVQMVMTQEIKMEGLIKAKEE
jgi:hypothetical protein